MVTVLPLSEALALGDPGHVQHHNDLAHYVDELFTRFYYAKDYGAAFDGVTDDRVAIQAAIDACATAGGGIVQCPAGTALVSLAAHPNGTNGIGNAALVLRSGVTVRGVRRDLTTIKLKNATIVSGTQNRLVTNWDMTTGADHDLELMDLTLNGNAANNGSATSAAHGAQMWQAKGIRYLRVDSKNNRGNDTATYETFSLDAVRSERVLMDDCRVFTDDGGSTATGFSQNFCNRVLFNNCRGFDQFAGHGFTSYSGSNVAYVNCHADNNGMSSPTSSGQGFNLEGTSAFRYVSCTSGLSNAYDANNGTPNTYTQGTPRGNDSCGFSISTLVGGGDGELVGCFAANNVRGLAIFGSVAGTSAAGTTGTTVTSSAALFTPAMIGRWVQVNGGTWVQITAFASSTSVTVSAAHGGSTAQVINIMAGSVRVRGGSVHNNTSGVQFLDATTTLKRLTIRMTNIDLGVLHDNTNDMVDVGNGSGTTVARASGRATAASNDAWATTVEFFNPYPCPMEAIVVTGTASTSKRGGHPLSSSDSTGTNSGTFMIEPGGAITATAASVRWYFR